nr:hypothetical protein [Candidatus Freyrarchaeum guaymaensis]
MIVLKKYTTIPVLVEVKKVLDEVRGGKEWSDFLMSLIDENRRLRRMLAARNVQERFSLVEKSVSASYEEFRQGFKLRE